MQIKDYKNSLQGMIRLQKFQLPEKKKRHVAMLSFFEHFFIDFKSISQYFQRKIQDTVRAYGTLVWDTGFIKNTITNAGIAQVALLTGDASATPFTYLEVGTSSTAPAAGQTALAAAITDSGLARASATFSRSTTNLSNDTSQWDYTWTASAQKAIEEIGVFNASSAGTMLGRALTATKTVLNGEQLMATYKVIHT